MYKTIIKQRIQSVYARNASLGNLLKGQYDLLVQTNASSQAWKDFEQDLQIVEKGL